MFYNQVSQESTTTSPYFTPAVIDNACNKCASEIGSPTAFSSQCDICKTMTVSTVKTYGYADLLVYLLLVGVTIFVISILVKARGGRRRL